MTLQGAKDQIARENGYDAWGLKIYENGDEMMEKLWGEVAHLVHYEACRKQREICAENIRPMMYTMESGRTPREGLNIAYYNAIDSIKNAPEPNPYLIPLSNEEGRF